MTSPYGCPPGPLRETLAALSGGQNRRGALRETWANSRLTALSSLDASTFTRLRAIVLLSSKFARVIEYQTAQFRVGVQRKAPKSATTRCSMPPSGPDIHPKAAD